jgi:WW domain
MQAPMYGGYQQIGHPHGQQMYGAHQQSYGHNPGSQQYATPTIPYGLSPYQSAPGYPQQAPSYGAPPPQQQAPANLVIPLASSWKSAAAADGQVYYYNEKTGETQWDKPAGMS